MRKVRRPRSWPISLEAVSAAAVAKAPAKARAKSTRIAGWRRRTGRRRSATPALARACRAPAPPAFLLRELGRGLLAVAELGAGAAEDEEGEQQEIPAPVQEGVDQEADEEAGDDARAVHRARRIGRAGERRVDGGGDSEPRRQAGVGAGTRPSAPGSAAARAGRGRRPAARRCCRRAPAAAIRARRRAGRWRSRRRARTPRSSGLDRRRPLTSSTAAARVPKSDVGERSHPALPRVPGELRAGRATCRRPRPCRRRRRGCPRPRPPLPAAGRRRGSAAARRADRGRCRARRRQSRLVPRARAGGRRCAAAGRG